MDLVSYEKVYGEHIPVRGRFLQGLPEGIPGGGSNSIRPRRNLSKYSVKYASN